MNGVITFEALVRWIAHIDMIPDARA
jgi:hypothetical protein